MNDVDSSISQSEEQPVTTVKSLKELVSLVSGKKLDMTPSPGDAGLAEILPFPFLAIVGQEEMKLALLLSLVNPLIGGVLLIGPRGTGKTTAIRSLLDILPSVIRSRCFYGCLPEDVENAGLDAVCPDCAQKYGEGLPLTYTDRVHLVELPLNSTLEDVVGGLDERALIHERLRLRRGILAQADQNVLCVDEVNLLKNDIIDAILDSASQGSYTVRRGAHSASYRSRFTLVGSMNPEEGWLRPQIMDRFGLRVVLRGLTLPDQRFEAYQHVHLYRTQPHQAVALYAVESEKVNSEIQEARNLLPRVVLPRDIAMSGISLVQSLRIPSLRAEITLFESARAMAAIDGRTIVIPEDMVSIAMMALRLRRSEFIEQFLDDQTRVDEDLNHRITEIFH